MGGCIQEMKEKGGRAGQAGCDPRKRGNGQTPGRQGEPGDREDSSEKILFAEESYRIIGACFEVYREKGNGFLEDVYQECLAIELADQGVPAVEKPRLRLEYKGLKLRREYQPDFLCYDQIILEIKAARQVSDEHRSQVINYLKATGKRLGLLVNFGCYPKAQFERLVH